MVICYFGDSLTLGYGDPSGLGWPGRMSGTLATLGVDVTGYNLGVRKNTSTKLLERMEAEASLRKLDGLDFKLVFSFGVADVFNKVEEQTTLDAAKEILTNAKELGEVLMIGPSPVSLAQANELLKPLSDGLGILCNDLSVPYADIFDELDGSETFHHALKDNDNVHPSAMGYAFMAQTILKTEPVRDFFGLE